MKALLASRALIVSVVVLLVSVVASAVAGALVVAGVSVLVATDGTTNDASTTWPKGSSTALPPTLARAVTGTPLQSASDT